MTQTYLFENLAENDKKNYMKKLAEFEITEAPKKYTFIEELTPIELEEFEETSAVNGCDIVAIENTLFFI